MFQIDRSEIKPTIAIFQQDDTGKSASDFITSNTQPTLVGTAEALSTLSLSIDGKLIDSTISVDKDNVWSYKLPEALAEDSYKITIYSKDSIGNTSEETDAKIVIDTTPPEKPDAYATEAVYTNDNTPKLQGNNVPDDLTVKIILRLEGENDQVITVEPVNGAWTATLPTLNDGDSYQIMLKHEDVAGNQSKESDATVIEFSEVKATASTNIVLTPATDTGASNNDGITSNNKPVLEGNAQADTVSVAIKYTFKGVTKDTIATFDSEGKWSAPLDLSEINKSSISGDEISVEIRNKNKYGTESDVTEKSLRFDNNIEMATIKILAANDDDVTTKSEPTFTLGSGENVKVKAILTSANNSILATLTLDLSANADKSLNFWSDSTNPPPALADGDYTLELTSTDLAGNAIDSELTFSVDTTAPVKTTLALHSSSQGQVSNKTSSHDPILIGRAEPGANIKLYTEDGATKISLGEVIVPKSGDWEKSVSLINGEYKIIAATTDSAGNTAVEKTEFQLSVNKATVEKPTLKFDSDKYVIGDYDQDAETEHGGNISNVQFKISELPEDSKILLKIWAKDTVLFSESVTVSANGTVVFNSPSGQGPTLTLPDGLNILTASYDDEYGNESSQSSVERIFLDTTSPETPTISISNSAVATDTSSSTPIFNEQFIVFEGTADPFTTITVEARSKGGTDWFTYTEVNAVADGTWTTKDSGSSFKSDGDFEYRAISKDNIENKTSSIESELKVDTTVSFDITSDLTTNNQNAILIADIELRATVTIKSISKDGSVLNHTADKNGDVTADEWRLDLSNALPTEAKTSAGLPDDGTYEIIIEVTDEYSNTIEETIVLDIDSTTDTPILQTLEGTTLSESSPYTSGTLTTSINTPTLSGKAEVGSQVLILANEPTSGYSFLEKTTTDQNGVWEIELDTLDNVAGIEVTYNIVSTDDSDNSASLIVPIEYNI